MSLGAGRLPVRKARKPRGTPGYESFANRMASSVQVDLGRGIRTFKAKVDLEAVAKAVATGDARKVMATVPWDGLRPAVGRAFDKLSQASERGADDGLRALPRAARAELRYDPSNPRIGNYIDRRAGELVTTTRDGAKQAAKDAVTRAYRDGVPADVLARDIRGQIGLNEPQVLALRNYRAGLAAADRPDTDIGNLVDAYRERMLDYRAEMIARTEVRLAHNQGQLDIWQAATDDGLLPAGSEKVWVVDGNPCPDCLAMDGLRTGVDDTWTFRVHNAKGAVVRTFEVANPAESHPHCMCQMTLDVATAALAE